MSKRFYVQFGTVAESSLALSLDSLRALRRLAVEKGYQAIEKEKENQNQDQFRRAAW